MSIRAIIFDIDNTLLDWSQRNVNWFQDPDGHLHHMARAARYFSPEVTDQQIDAMITAFMEAYYAMLSTDLDEAPHLGDMIGESLTHARITAAPPPRDEVIKAYGWTQTPDVHVFPEVPNILKTLQADYRLGIVTNGYQPMYQRDKELAAYGVLEYFSDCRFSSADVGVLKPDVRIFQTALACLGVAAEEAVYVGDHPVMDIVGAQQAGMKAVWRTPNGQDADALSWIKPDGIIVSLEDLLPLLESW